MGLNLEMLGENGTDEGSESFLRLNYNTWHHAQDICSKLGELADFMYEEERTPEEYEQYISEFETLANETKSKPKGSDENPHLKCTDDTHLSDILEDVYQGLKKAKELDRNIVYL